ncbi:MAG: hypothetical protein RLZZ297_1051 [Chloroflexota bacterium]
MQWVNTTVIAPALDRQAAAAQLATHFEPHTPVWVARAPGRLDVMGGIADYSGSLVLQLPLAVAAVVYLQHRSDGRVLLESQADADVLGIQYAQFAAESVCGLGADLATLTANIRAAAAPDWARYVVGAVALYVTQTGVNLSGGVTIVIDSDVPLGKGVSSSAAIEVATMQALTASCGRVLDGTTLAMWCQQVENLIVGAPCGIMDQMTSACGAADMLLALRCQPATLLDPIRIPSSLTVWGIDSGVRHAVSGADYGSVRAAAFMGLRILERYADAQGLGRGHWNGYLANISPSEFAHHYANAVPVKMTGAEFLAAYGSHGDAVTTVDPARSYAVRAATTHPIQEHHRVQVFGALLGGPCDDTSAHLLGELMYQSHTSYSRCGLGTAATDAIVAAVQALGPQAGLYGAKITGGGSGGTVAVLGHPEAAPHIAAIAAQHGSGLVIHGSSDGAIRSPVSRWEARR